jgi:hypothetical protein
MAAAARRWESQRIGFGAGMGVQVIVEHCANRWRQRYRAHPSALRCVDAATVAMDGAARHGDDLTVWPDILAPQLCYLAPAEAAPGAQEHQSREPFRLDGVGLLGELGHSKNQRLALAVRVHRSIDHAWVR